MISKDRMMIRLEKLGIIAKIGEKFILTEKYKELLAMDIKALPTPEIVAPTPQKLSRDKILNPNTNGSDWPTDIIEQKGRMRATAFINACEIPSTSADNSYRIHGMDSDTVNIVGNIIETDTVSPPDMIAAVKHYYSTTEWPKSFKNFVKDGDIADVYEEWMSGGGPKKDLRSPGQWS